MNRKVTKLMSVVTSALMLTSTLLIAAADAGYLHINQADITATHIKINAARLQTDAPIPTDGSGEAFGYGLITTAGIDAVIVATTHFGLGDTEVDPTGEEFHVHYVDLNDVSGTNGPCDDSSSGDAALQVAALTFESPGNVHVANTPTKGKIIMTNLPASFDGTDALTGNPLTITPGTEVQDVVSFTLRALDTDGDGNVDHVCVDNLQSAESIIIRP